MRSALLCLFLTLGLAGCAAHGVRCEGSFEPVNVTPQPQGVRALPADPPAASP
jgi:hypothetical protein